MRTCRICGQQNVSSKTGLATCPKCSHEKQLIRQRRYQQNYRHSEKGRTTRQARYNRTKEKVKQYYQKNKGERQEYARIYNRSQKGKAIHTRYRRTQKGKAKSARAYANKRGAIVQGQPLTAKDWQEILKAHKYRCHYCKKRAILTMDHVIPLSKGGKHVKENIVPSCRHCNSTKSNKLVRLL